jgi:hypothetical protein
VFQRRVLVPDTQDYWVEAGNRLGCLRQVKLARSDVIGWRSSRGKNETKQP